MVQPVRIAMWSGPRNISTAMMRAWGNRPDTFVVDEPFYAYYLKATGKKHPGADEVIATGETDWRKVVEQLTGPIRKGKRIFFQKQMTHHLLPEVDREWIVQYTNCFLIRDPREVIASYIKKQEDPTLEDLGFVQQAEIFDFVRTRAKSTPPVVDAKDVLENPERILRLLCEAVGVEFTSRCFHGRLDCARPMASGPDIGTAKWQKRHRFSRIAETRSTCPIACARFTSSAANITSGFIEYRLH